MDNRDKFKGIIVAFYAPYDVAGDVSAAAAVNQAAFYREKGVKGLYLCGSSGECFLLDIEERKKIVEAVLKEFKGQMTMIVHVGAAATRESVELARHAEKMGADALSAVPSVYYKPPEAGIEQHWNQIINSTDLPFIIYNIPQLTGYDLSLHLLNRMLQNKKVIGVKNTSLSGYQVEQFKKAGGEDFIVFNGPDEQYLAGRIMGAEAGIGGTYGAMPELFLHLEKCFAAGNIGAAQKCQVKINEIIAAMLEFPCLYAVTKEILRLRNVPVGVPRAPMLPLAAGDYPKVKAIYEKIIRYTQEIK